MNLFGLPDGFIGGSKSTEYPTQFLTSHNTQGSTTFLTNGYDTYYYKIVNTADERVQAFRSPLNYNSSTDIYTLTVTIFQSTANGISVANAAGRVGYTSEVTSAMWQCTFNSYAYNYAVSNGGYFTRSVTRITSPVTTGFGFDLNDGNFVTWITGGTNYDFIAKSGGIQTYSLQNTSSSTNVITSYNTSVSTSHITYG